MTAFLDAFWPNLAATILGVVLGVPIALFLNRSLFKYQRQVESTEANMRLGNSIEVLIDACRYNSKVLDSIKQLSLVGKVMRNPDLRITTWDAVGDIFSGLCSEPVLLQMLSHHWLRLHRVQALSDEMFKREIEKSRSEIMDKLLVQEFWQVLHDNARDLSAHAAEIIEKLEKLKKIV